MTEREKTHTFVVYVENKPGVLNRIASLFRRRGYNIESLTVGHTERPNISRMTIVSSIGEGAAHRVEANIYKLVSVLSVEDVTHATTISRSLALIKVVASEESRHRLMEIVRVFRARVVDLAPRSLIIEITGAEDKIHALVDVLRPFGILEMVRTGQVVMRRGVQERAESSSPKPAQDDIGRSEQKTGPGPSGANALVEAEHPGSV
ncbi:MAG: acetolactate synthase small subunit [Acidobacteria bacterium]|nr:MAG: acetolactate synthase small subunit [Acidobacteriota bacterium]